MLNNYAALLKKHLPEDDECREYAAVIADTAAELSDLVGNVLRLNKLEHSALPPQTHPFDLCRQLCDCVIRYEDKWTAKHIEINMDIEDRCKITSEEDLLTLVWNNLIDNAVKFTPAGGTISVTQRSSSSGVTVTVADDGCGIGEEHLAHVFDKFFQADAARATEGNGLGLALVKQVVTLLGGEITVQSEPGAGAAFTVTLPRVS